MKGYINYSRREYCKAISCPVQLELEKQVPNSEAYEAVRKKCKEACIHTTHEFHAWLIEHGYLVIRPK